MLAADAPFQIGDWSFKYAIAHLADDGFVKLPARIHQSRAAPACRDQAGRRLCSSQFMVRYGTRSSP